MFIITENRAKNENIKTTEVFFLTLPLIQFAGILDLEEYHEKESMTCLVYNASLHPDNMT